MSETATASAPARSKRTGLIAALTILGGALSGVGSNCAAKAAAPSEVAIVQTEIAGLRKDIADVLTRLRTVELVQAREEGAAAERVRRHR